MAETYTVTIVVQSASGTYTRTLTFESQTDADKAQSKLVAQVEKMT